MSIFQTGIESAQREAAHSGGGGKFADFFSLEAPPNGQIEGETKVIRHLYDMAANPAFPHVGTIITTRIHLGVPTRPKPDWEKGNWYAHQSATCRNTTLEAGAKLWEVMDDAKEYRGCWICDHVKKKDKKGVLRPHYASVRNWGLCVVRKEVFLSPGVVTYEDATKEIEDESGNIQVVPDVQILKFGLQNFWNKFDGAFKARGTLLNCDYIVTRHHGGTDTDYIVGQAEPVSLRNPDGTFVINPATGLAMPLDYRDPEIYKNYTGIADIDRIVMTQATADYQRRWFDESYTPKKVTEAGAEGSEGGQPQAQAPTNDVASLEALTAMTQRLDGYAAPVVPQPGQTPGQ